MVPIAIDLSNEDVCTSQDYLLRNGGYDKAASITHSPHKFWVDALNWQKGGWSRFGEFGRFPNCYWFKIVFLFVIVLFIPLNMCKQMMTVGSGHGIKERMFNVPQYHTRFYLFIKIYAAIYFIIPLCHNTCIDLPLSSLPTYLQLQLKLY